MTKQELKPIDTSKYRITETGQVLKMTKEENENEMIKDEMKDKISMALKDPILQQGFEIICRNLAELEKENAELKEQVENRNCSNCRRGKAGCPNDGSCHNFSLWQPFINPQLTKAKKIIRNCLNLWNNVMTEETVRALIKEAEQFIKEVEK